jgi:hypothetical protein
VTTPDGALRALAALLEASAEQHSASVRRYAELVWDTLQGGGRLYFAGNGGSAADAQHCAAEYVVRYGRDRRALPRPPRREPPADRRGSERTYNPVPPTASG